MRGILHAFILISLVVVLGACSPKSPDALHALEPVQVESPTPHVEPIPKGAVDIQGILDIDEATAQHTLGTVLLDATYATLRVRVFPILSVPSKDPYPITQDIHSARFFNSGGLELFRKSDSRRLGAFYRLHMNSKNRTVFADAKAFPLEEMIIRPLNSSITTTFRWDNSRVKVEYRGQFMLEPSSHEVVDKTTDQVIHTGRYWSVVNFVGREDYLKSVVPSEMPASFAGEALKAQAIAARTYAVFHAMLARRHYQRNWDVDPTTWYQSYRGAQVEHSAKITPAVEATDGIVLTSSDKLIEAFFSANSGGLTCSVSECFGAADRPYIVSKVDAPGVREKPGGSWAAQLTTVDIATRLEKMQAEGKLRISDLVPNYHGASSLKGVTPLEIGEAARVRRLSLQLADGSEVPLTFEQSREMRWQFRGATMYYSLTPIDGTAKQDIRGFGLGHGVGMSQWGAHLFATSGTTFEQILKYYYEGVDLFQIPAAN